MRVTTHELAEMYIKWWHLKQVGNVYMKVNSNYCFKEINDGVSYLKEGLGCILEMQHHILRFLLILKGYESTFPWGKKMEEEVDQHMLEEDYREVHEYVRWQFNRFKMLIIMLCVEDGD